MSSNDGLINVNTLRDDDGSLLGPPFSIRYGIYDGTVFVDDDQSMEG